MIRMLFEDNKNMGISKLLMNYYLDYCIEFSEGNHNIENTLKELLADGKINKSDDVIVFVDLVPDNAETVEVYKSISKYIRENKLTNLHLIPIICIESICINVFLSESIYDRNVIKSAIDLQDYRNITLNSRRRLLSIESLEKYNKSVLYNYSNCTEQNGNFFLRDCICNKPIRNLDLCKERDLSSKSKLLVNSLPLHWSELYEAFIDCNGRFNEFDIARKIGEDRYYSMAERYLKYGYISSIQSLDFVCDNEVDLV